MRKSIKQFRTKRRLLGANPYQKTDSESLVTVGFSLNNILLLRLILCNDRLYNDPILWKEIHEMVAQTDFDVTFGPMNQDTYKSMLALDRYSKRGRTVFVNVTTRRQALSAVGALVDEYFESLGTEDGEQVVSEMNIPLDVMQAIQDKYAYNPPEISEEECMFQ